MQRRIAFAKINAAALVRLPALVARWLPGGELHGREYAALNPRRADRAAGSFRINVASGRWADFATGDKGGDPVSLFAYLERMDQVQAAIELARVLNVDPYEREPRPWRR